MNRDVAVTLFLIGFPVIIGIAGFSFALLVRRAATFRCPSCGGRLAKTEITISGATCRHCDWRVVAKDSQIESNEQFRQKEHERK